MTLRAAGRLGTAFTLAMLALAAAAGSGVLDLPELPASAYRPLPGSTLVSRPAPAFVQAQGRQGALGLWSVLARTGASAAPVPVALVRESAAAAQGAKGPSVTVQFLPEAGRPDLDVLALEHLYALLLQQPGSGRFGLVIGPTSTSAAPAAESHGTLLRRLVDLRAAAAARAGQTLPVRPWHSVAMQGASPKATSAKPDPDDVSVRLLDGPKPLAGQAVYFHRAPHHGCTARTRPDGIAACRLVDQHGDEGDHADEHGEPPVVVTFPGAARADRMLPPTTFVLPARKG